MNEQELKWAENNLEIFEGIDLELDQVINSKAYYIFHEAEDKEFPEIKYKMYGDHKDNFIYAEATAENHRWVARFKSCLIYPAMIDRMFGAEVGDFNGFYITTGHLFEQYIRRHLNGNSISKRSE